MMGREMVLLTIPAGPMPVVREDEANQTAEGREFVEKTEASRSVLIQMFLGQGIYPGMRRVDRWRRMGPTGLLRGQMPAGVCWPSRGGRN